LRKIASLIPFALLIVTPGCSGDVKGKRSPAKAPLVQENLIQESWMVRVALTTSGMRHGVVHAAHEAEYRTKNGSEHHLDGGIKLTLFDDNGKAITTITAENAVIHDNQDMEATGSVVVTSTEGTILTTEYIRRSAKDTMIRSDRAVTITMPEEIIRGEGFESDQTLKRYRIFRGSGEALIQQ